MRPRHWARWAATLALCLLMAPAVQCQELDDDALEAADEGLEVVPLRRLDVVQNKSFTKEGRFEIYPNAFGLITNNHFARRQIAMTGIGLAYHVKEQVYFDFTAQYYPFLGPSDIDFNNLKTLTYALLSLGTGSQDPEPVVVSTEKLFLGASIGFSPAYGKINLVAEHVQNFDISFLAGVGYLMVEDHSYVATYDSEGYFVVQEVAEEFETRNFPTGHVGVASRFPLTAWFALKADARFVGYAEQVPDYSGPRTTDENGDPVYPSKTAFASSFMVTVGASFFLPN